MYLNKLTCRVQQLDVTIQDGQHKLQLVPGQGTVRVPHAVQDVRYHGPAQQQLVVM